MREIVLLADVRVFIKTGGDPIKNESEIEWLENNYIPEGWEVKVGEPEIVVYNGIYKLGVPVFLDLFLDSELHFILVEETGLTRSQILN